MGDGKPTNIGGRHYPLTQKYQYAIQSKIVHVVLWSFLNGTWRLNLLFPNLPDAFLRGSNLETDPCGISLVSHDFQVRRSNFSIFGQTHISYCWLYIPQKNIPGVFPLIDDVPMIFHQTWWSHIWLTSPLKFPPCTSTFLYDGSIISQ